MEPNEWQKYKNKKSTEYTQKITSQARIAEEQLLEGLNESEVYDYMLSKLNFCHGPNGEKCPVCGDTIAEVSFSDSSLQYCPTCQTGGKKLADRRMSRLLK